MAIENLGWDPMITDASPPSLHCSCFSIDAHSDHAINDKRIPSAASSQTTSDARLLHSSYTHAIFTVVLAINDKHALPIKHLPTIYEYYIVKRTSYIFDWHWTANI
jgi:hypothetical protein